MELSTYSSIATPFHLIRMYEGERTIRAGGNLYLPFLVQISQVFAVVNFINNSEVLTPLFGRTVEINPFYIVATLVAFGFFLNLPVINKHLNKTTLVSETTVTGTGLDNKKFSVVIPAHKKEPGPISKLLSKAIAPLANQMEKNTPLSRTALFIFNNVSNLGLIITIATSISLIAKGERRKGATALGIFATKGAIEIASSLDEIAKKVQEQGFPTCGKKLKGVSKRIFIPLSRIRYNFNNLSRAISSVSSYTTLYTGNKAEKIISCINLVDGHFGNLVYRNYKWGCGEQKEEPIRQKLHHPIYPYHSGDQYPRVDETHIRPIELPVEPSLDLETILRPLYKDSNYSDDYYLIKSKTDEELKKKIIEGTIKPEVEELKNYVQEGVKLFIRAVVEQKFVAGELSTQKDNDRLRIMTKCCVEKWSESLSKDDLPKEDLFLIQDAIFSIGLVGHYCADGIFLSIENYYSDYVDPTASGVGAKLLAFLQKMRRNILDGIIEDKTFTFQALVEDNKDIHARNESLLENYWLANEPPTFGAQAVHGDRMSWITVGAHYMQYNPLKNRRERYTPRTICEAINEDLSNGTKAVIPFGEYYDWFKKWLLSSGKCTTNIEAAKVLKKHVLRKIKLKDNDGNLTGEYRFEIKENYLLLMLVEMGILKVPNDSSYLQKT